MYFNSRTAEIAFLKDFLAVPKNIVITTHFKPDGDALGSSLGLYNFLLQENHKVAVIAPSDYPDFLNWMEGNDQVINFQLQADAARECLKKADLIFCLDFNDASRVEQLGDLLLASGAVKVLIDHHLDPKDFCQYTFSFPAAAATCELVYYFMEALGHHGFMNRAIAECLYTGIMTDTGSFRFPSMSASLHRVIASLLEAGARHSMIHELIYDSFRENRLRLLGFCISEKMVVLPRFRTAYIAVNEDELNRFKFQTGDTEGVVNYPLGISGIVLSAFFSEKQGMVKISFRSKEGFSVKELAENHFSGGGHQAAAGGKSFESLQQTVDKFIALLPGLKLEA